MTSTPEALARRAVACPRWRWMPGMLIADNGAGMRFLWEDERYLHGMAAEVDGLWMRMSKHRERLPGLADPATLGCLLALVREACGDPLIHATPQPRQFGSGRETIRWRVRRIEIEAATEAEALIAALEAAP